MKQTNMENSNTFLTESAEEFNDRFVRCLRLLYVIAGRVLGGPEGTVEAVENCYATASRNPPHFESEGAFRGWLLRVLIDEAAQILYQKRPPANWQEMIFRQSA